MRIHFFQHVPFEGLGSIGDWAEKSGVDITPIRFHQGDALPPLAEVTHLIVMGGPMGVHDWNRFPWLTPEKRFMRKIMEAGKAVLGICLGAQLMADALGAAVYPNTTPEIGWFPIRKSSQAQADETAAFLPASLEVFHWHGDTFDLPAGARCLAHSEACPQQGFYLGQTIIGLQFHLETTPESMNALMANCSDDLKGGPFVQSAEQIRAVTDRFAPNQAIMDNLMVQWCA